MEVLRRTERAMIRVMCGVKLIDRRNNEELMSLGLEESLDRMAKVSSIRWYGHVLGGEEENVLLKALYFVLLGRIGRGRPKQTWKKQVEKEMHNDGLVMKDACDRDKWREMVKSMNPANSVDGEETGSKLIMNYYIHIQYLTKKDYTKLFSA